MLTDLRQTITDAVKNWFPAADCQTHPGRFNLAEIKRIGVKTPAIRVACLGLPTGEAVGDGEADRAVAWAAYILTTDKRGLPRDAAVIAMAQDLVLRLAGQRWNTSGVHPVADDAIRAENLYSSDVDGHGIALWAVAWTQRVRMGDNAYPNGPVLSAEQYAGDDDEPGEDAP